MTAKGPPFSLWLREFPHGVQIITSPLRRVKYADKQLSDGQPVLVVPDILSSDQSTSLLRRTLDAVGYHAYPSQMGFLTGITPKAFAKAEARLLDVHEREGRKVVLLGWSLGGLYSRVLAQRHPDKVAMVVTMGTPFSGSRRSNNAWRLYEAINDHKVDAPKVPDDPSIKPPVHTVAVWSPNDGVISPECARGLPQERDVEIEVATRHFALGADRRSIGQIVALLGDQLERPTNAVST